MPKDQTNTNPTLAEVYRLVQRNEQDSREHRMEILDGLKEIKEVVYATKSETSKTNGRVMRLEDRMTEVEKVANTAATDIGYFKGREKWIMGAMAVVILISGMIPFIFKLYIGSIVTDAVTAAVAKLEAK